MSELRELFGPDGPLARRIEGYRVRDSQIEMAERIGEAIDHAGVLIAEAGTGTGKTYAYLVPALRSGGKVIISTGTKGLLPPSQASAGLAKDVSINGNAVTSVSVTPLTGLVTITYNTKVVNGGTLVLSPITGSGGVAWTCKIPSGSAIKQQWVPSSCR